MKRNWPTDLFAKGFIFTGSILTIAGLYNAFTWYQNWLSVNPGVWIPTITYRPATANVMAPILNLTAILAIVFLYHTKGVGKKIFFATITLAVLFMLFLTSSRGGWLGAGAGLGLLMVVIGYLEKDRLVDIFIKIKANKVLFGFLIISVFVVIGISGYILYKQAIHPTHGSIFNSRTAFWQTAIATFKDNPILGQGPFTYGSAFLSFYSTPPGQVWTHAHSSLMNLLAEMGILGFFALAFLAISYFRVFFKNFKQKIRQSFLFLPTTAFILAYLIHSLFDSLHMEPALIWSLAILMGAAIAENPQSLNQNNSAVKKRPWWVLILIAFAWFGIWTITPYYQAVELANQNQWQQAYEKFEQAVKRDPGNALTHQQLALSAAVLAQQGDPAMLDVAIKALQTTIQHEPSWALNHANLASLHFTKYDTQNGLLYAENAILLAPNSTLFKLIYNPTWSKVDFSEIYSVSSNMRQRLSNEYLLNNEETALRLSEFHQYSWAHNIEAKVHLENGDLISANRALLNAELAYAANNSDSIETKWLWAEFYAKKGDYEEAIQRGKAAYDLYTNYGVFGPGTFGILQYAPRMFRMKAMALEIIPQMIDIPVPEEWVQRSKLVESWESEIPRR